jgi:hypothetical protein
MMAWSGVEPGPAAGLALDDSDCRPSST